MSKVNKYDIEYEIARVYPYTRCDEYSHAWECHQATVYSYYSENLKYYTEGKLTLERINEWLKLPEENRSKCETEAAKKTLKFLEQDSFIGKIFNKEIKEKNKEIKKLQNEIKELKEKIKEIESEEE